MAPNTPPSHVAGSYSYIPNQHTHHLQEPGWAKWTGQCLPNIMDLYCDQTSASDHRGVRQVATVAASFPIVTSPSFSWNDFHCNKRASTLPLHLFFSFSLFGNWASKTRHWEATACSNCCGKASQKIKIRISMGSNNSTLGYTSKEVKSGSQKILLRYLCRRCLFIAALCIIAKMWKQPKCPWWYEWINKVWYTLQWLLFSLTRRQFWHMLLHG